MDGDGDKDLDNNETDEDGPTGGIPGSAPSNRGSGPAFRPAASRRGQRVTPSP